MSGSSGESIDRTPSATVDVCIIGAGVAGGLVADSLTQRGYDVLILDAGKRFDLSEHADVYEHLERAIRPEIEREQLWEMGGKRDDYSLSLADGVFFRMNEQRVKAVGGSTLAWAAYTPRFGEKDFEMQSRYGLANDWPIRYADLEPYYVATERALGVAGAPGEHSPPRSEPYPMEPFPYSPGDRLFRDVCDSLDISLMPTPQARNSSGYDGRSSCVNYSTCTPFCPSGAKYDGTVHIEKAEAGGARVIDQAPAQRLEHDEDGETVEAVEYATPDGNRHRQTAREFVIACGGIETPRLLLLSASDHYPDGLANTSGVVGRYFHAGLSVSTTAEIDEPVQREPVGFGTMMSREFYDPPDTFPGSIRLVFRNENPPSPVGVALRGGHTSFEATVFEGALGVDWGDDLLETIRAQDPGDNRRLRVSSSVEQLPEAHNRISLDESTTDTYGNPVPKVTFEIGDHALESMNRGLDIHRDIFAEMGAEILVEGNPAEQGIGNHHKGTTRMGADPTTSVVNPSCRTHDLTNCWIASSSVFTTGGAVNPTLTIGALALKTADHIHETLQRH